MSNAPKRVNYQAAAEFLGIPAGTLRSMVHRKQVPHIRMGPQLVRFDLDELREWVSKHSVASNEETG